MQQQSLVRFQPPTLSLQVQHLKHLGSPGRPRVGKKLYRHSVRILCDVFDLNKSGLKNVAFKILLK